MMCFSCESDGGRSAAGAPATLNLGVPPMSATLPLQPSSPAITHLHVCMHKACAFFAS